MKSFSTSQIKWGKIIRRATGPTNKNLKDFIFFLINKYIKSNLILIIKYKKRYLDKKPNPMKSPKRIKSCVLSEFIQRQVKKILKAQKGNCEILTLNSGVVKL